MVSKPGYIQKVYFSLREANCLHVGRDVHDPARSSRSGEVTSSLKAKSVPTLNSSGRSWLMRIAGLELVGGIANALTTPNVATVYWDDLTPLDDMFVLPKPPLNVRPSDRDTRDTTATY